MPSYVLDIETLLILVARLKRSGTLTTTIQLPRLGKCAAQLIIIDGILTVCMIIDEQRKIIAQGEQALNLLAHRQAEWNWEHTSQQSPLIAPGPLRVQAPQQAPSAIPRLQRHVTQRSLQTFPRSERRILLLVDGTHTIAEIAHMLGVPAQTIREQLLRFRDQGLLLLEE